MNAKGFYNQVIIGNAEYYMRVIIYTYNKFKHFKLYYASPTSLFSQMYGMWY